MRKEKLANYFYFPLEYNCREFYRDKFYIQSNKDILFDRNLKYAIENSYVNKSFFENNKIYRPENYKKGY